MKVLILPSWQMTDKEPYAGIFFFEQAAALSEYCDVKILCVENFNFSKIFIYIFKNKLAYSVYGKLDKIDILTINTEIFKGFKFINNKLLRCLFNKVFKKYNWQPDIIHSHSVYPAGIYASIISKIFKIPYIITEHRSNLNILFNNAKILNNVTNAYNNADTVTAVSHSVVDELSVLIDRKIDIIPNFIDTDFYEIEQQSNVNKVCINLLYIGLLIKRKGIDILLEALFMLKKNNNYNFKLSIIGEGEERISLKELADNLGISDCVEFKGTLSREENKKELSDCDLFVLPSRKETFGVVLIEAMSCGIPVVATRCGGPEYIVNDISGVIVEKENAEDLAKGIYFVSENIKKYNSREIRKYAIENFGKVKVSKEICNLYESILGIS